MDGAKLLFEEFELSFNTTNAGGNDVSVLRLISSTASMYSNSKLVSGQICSFKSFILAEVECNEFNNLIPQHYFYHYHFISPSHFCGTAIVRWFN